MRKIIINDQIVADPEICHGKPVFAGTRVMVWQVLELLADGETLKEIINAFPSLSATHIKAALDYASSLTRENYVIVPIQPAFSA